MSTKGNKLTHVSGTFLVQADGAFLNGAGIDKRREDKNTTVPKTYRDGIGNRVPYVSAQAWRRWLRNTLIEETGWPASELRAIDLSEKGTTNKIAGELNPVDYAEDDIFGYMRAAKGQGRESVSDDGENSAEEQLRQEQVKLFNKATKDIKIFQTGRRGSGKTAKEITNEERIKLAKEVVADLQTETERRSKQEDEALDEQVVDKLASIAHVLQEEADIKAALPRIRESLVDVMQAFNPGRLKALMRASPFASSLLVSVRRKGWEGLDNGFVHLKEGTPLPYNTEFYNTHLQGAFCLDYARLGIFWNVGDRIELDEQKAERFLRDHKIRITQDLRESGKVYEMTNAATERKKRGAALLQPLAVLRGGAKQAQFGTDVSPKAYVLAGLSCGNPIFNHLFTDDCGEIAFNTDAFKEVLQDYADRIVTPVFVGVRAGTLKEHAKIRDLSGWWEVSKSETTMSGTATLDGPKKERPPTGVAVEIKVVTPVEAGRCMGELLP